MVRTDRVYFVLLVAFLGAIGILDTAMLNPTISAYAESLGADEVTASFIAGLYSIVAIPASLIMGLTIDAVGRKRALSIGLGLTAIWVYGYSISTTPVHLMVFRVAHSISGSLVFPASIAMVVDAARQRMSTGIGVFWLVIGAAIGIGSFTSAVLVRSFGFQPLYLLVALVSVAGTAIAITLPETAKKRMMPRASLRVLAGSMGWLSVAYLSIFSLYFAFGVIVGSLSLTVIRAGVSPQEAAGTVGLYIGIATVVSLPLFYFVGRAVGRIGPIKVLAGGAMATGVSQLLLMVSQLPPYTYVSSICLGVGIASVFVASTALAALPEARGASVGLHQTANIAGVAVGAPISGLLLSSFGAMAPFAAALGVQVLSLVVIAATREVTRPAELEIIGTFPKPAPAEKSHDSS